MALTDNLISYWQLDEASGDAIDAHGSNDLTDVNTVGSATGIISNARDYEADNSEAHNIADNTDLSTGDIAFTFTAWVKAESFGADRVIIGKINSGATQMDYILRYRASVDRFQWRVSSDGSSAADVNADSLGAPSTATWYFIVVDHDPTANQTSIQVNNGTKDTLSHSAGVFDGNGGFSLGREGDRLTDYWDGLIDEVGFWKRILTAEERTQLYNGGAGLAYPFAASGTSPPEVPYVLRGGGIAEIAWPAWQQSFRF